VQDGLVDANLLGPSDDVGVWSVDLKTPRPESGDVHDRSDRYVMSA
jgi:hypothetical protein